MRKSERREVLPAEGYELHVVGVPRAGIRDLYHALLRVNGWVAVGFIVAAYLLLNGLFAVLYVELGGIHGADPASFLDAYVFSVQTMGTIGYGAMYPETPAAHVLVVAESVTGLLTTAMATGLVFARFSQARARVVFCSRAAIAPMDGVPTLMMRLGNERRSRIVGATFHATLTRSVRTREGATMYRSIDLTLVRSRAPALARSWTVMHRIEPDSPLWGSSPAQLAAEEAELTLEVAGVDDTTLQAVHAQYVWRDHAIVWGARLADVMSETPDGNLLLDLRRFHDLTPTEPAEAFPYPAGAADRDR
jgi:inward rectifier potassium channel